MGVSHYKVALTVKGLVHIGNGQSYGKKDYFKGKDGRICVLDPGKFIEQLRKECPEQIDSYCDFLLKSDDKLNEWLKGQRVRPTKEAIAYKISGSSLGKQCQVEEFIKNPYDGNPYVPGSSFKGALRTALFAEIIERDRDAYEATYLSSHNGKNNSDWRTSENADSDLEEKVFKREHPDSNQPEVINDIMRFVSVSDSEPLSTECLVLAQKYDRFSPDDEKVRKGKKENRINTYRECLKPETVVNLQVDIDDRINNNDYLPFNLDAEHIASIFQDFNKRYKECFLDYFDISDVDNGEVQSSTQPDDGYCHHMIEIDFGDHIEKIRCKKRAVDGTGYCKDHQDEARQTDNLIESKAICYLGGGVDFDSKTVLNALFADNNKRLDEISKTISAKADTKHRHWQDKNLGVSPHTLKLGYADGEKYLMGKCELSIYLKQNS